PPRAETPGIVDGVRDALRRAPATGALVLLTLALFPATLFRDGAIWDFTLRWLMFVPIERVGDFIQFATLQATLRAGEFWHLWTPALLHFGVVHLAFNLLWLWEFGRRIEAADGRMRLFEVVIVLAPISNGVQYALMDGGPVFGGLSGVVYGLLGYIVTAYRRYPQPAYNLNSGLVVMLLLFLVMFSTGVTEPFGLNIANGAHWGGLAAGVIWALIRVRPPKPGDGERVQA
ncbi:MAG TPA: rhomboid family intramembrane serine protease, partial [Pseudomonadales bacterium]|nr:rhomboid family intramembrane serine protease [Pseudomonadales bacterium]